MSYYVWLRRLTNTKTPLNLMVIFKGLLFNPETHGHITKTHYDIYYIINGVVFYTFEIREESNDNL